MKIYWAARRLCWGVATVLGFGAALLMWPSSLVLVIFVLISFGAGLCRYLVVQGGSTAAGVSWSNWPALARHAVRGGLGGVALAGLADISIGLALLLALVATLTSYRCIAALRSGIANKPGPVPVEPPSGRYAVEAQLQEVAGEVDQACLRALSTAELCLAWRRSYCSLVGTTSLRVRAVVVASRQAYLDEMERRDARGLTAWLAAGARAASGPERYLDDAC